LPEATGQQVLAAVIRFAGTPRRNRKNCDENLQHVSLHGGFTSEFGSWFRFVLQFCGNIPRSVFFGLAREDSPRDSRD
jgi:hypothetical protein